MHIMEKEDLRHEMIRRLRAFPGKEWESEKLCRAIAESPEWQEAGTVLAYYPLPTEPDIRPLLEDRRVLLPYIEDGIMRFSESRNLRKSGFGTMEPEHIPASYGSALMLVPLLGYCGLYRLGRGGGFYDRYIAGHRSRITAAGVAFSICRCSFTPEGHDEKLDRIFHI